MVENEGDVCTVTVVTSQVNKRISWKPNAIKLKYKTIAMCKNQKNRR